MAAPARLRPLIAALATATLVLPFVTGAAPARAVSRVPAEQAVALPTSLGTAAAIVADVDGDGVRELVRTGRWDRNPGLLGLQVVTIAGDGTPREHEPALVMRTASTDDHTEGNNPGEAALLPVGALEPTRLVAWRVAGEERVLAASIGRAESERPCCLALLAVGIATSGETSLTPILTSGFSAEAVLAADLDGDETDELVVLETEDGVAAGVRDVHVLRWDGESIRALEAHVSRAFDVGALQHLGDSDGARGTEVGFVAAPVPGAGAQTLHRISLDSFGAIRLERAQLPFDGSVLPMPVPDANRLALVSAADSVLLAWPSGALTMEITSTSFRGGTPLGVIADGDESLLFIERGGALDVLDAALQSRQGISSGVAATWFAGSSWHAYSGALPGGDEAGRQALIFQGRLVGGPGRDSVVAGFPHVRTVAALPAKTPIGLFGPELGFAAVAEGTSLATERDGGRLRVGSGERANEIWIVPTNVFLSPEADDGLLVPPLSGGVVDGRQPARRVLLTATPIFASVQAPAGSLVRVVGEGAAVRDAVVGGDGIARIALAEVVDERTDYGFTARLRVRTPAGHGYGAQWQVRVVRRAPRLDVSVPMAPLSFGVAVSGKTDPLATVIVDGSQVVPAPDGSFSAEVRAGLLPRTVGVRAVDRLGNSAERTVSVVAIVDYRRLPWIPIVGVVTLLIAGVLYLRAPRPTARHRAAGVEDGVLEEIE